MGVALWCSVPAAEENLTTSKWLFQRCLEQRERRGHRTNRCVRRGGTRECQPHAQDRSRLRRNPPVSLRPRCGTRPGSRAGRRRYGLRSRPGRERHRADHCRPFRPARALDVAREPRVRHRRGDGACLRARHHVQAHWKRQAFGPKRSRRRWIVIEGYGARRRAARRSDRDDQPCAGPAPGTRRHQREPLSPPPTMSADRNVRFFDGVRGAGELHGPPVGAGFRSRRDALRLGGYPAECRNGVRWEREPRKSECHDEGRSWARVS